MPKLGWRVLYKRVSADDIDTELYRMLGAKAAQLKSAKYSSSASPLSKTSNPSQHQPLVGAVSMDHL